MTSTMTNPFQSMHSISSNRVSDPSNPGQQNQSGVPHRRGVPRRGRARRAVAAAEFAVCLPILVLLVFGAIEASSFIFLKQALSVAAYEGAREAALNNSTSTAAKDRAANILAARNVQGFEVRFPDGDPNAVQRGNEISVEVVAPTQPNSPLAGQFVSNRDLVARVVMLKE